MTLLKTGICAIDSFGSVGCEILKNLRIYPIEVLRFLN